MTKPNGRRDPIVEKRGRQQQRELAVLKAVATLPAACQTPNAAVFEILRQGIDIPHSTLAQILRRLERRGEISLARKRV